MKKKLKPVAINIDPKAYEAEVKRQKDLTNMFKHATKEVDPNDLNGIMDALFKAFKGKS